MLVFANLQFLGKILVDFSKAMNIWMLAQKQIKLA